MKVFLDANVLFTAAHNPRGKAALLIELGERGYWMLFSSPYALEEARRNLERKFPRGMNDLESLRLKLQLVDHHPNSPFPEGLAQKDRPIFQAAFACGASHLITGDIKDFGPYMKRPETAFGVQIETVAEFLNSWRAASAQ